MNARNVSTFSFGNTSSAENIKDDIFDQLWALPTKERLLNYYIGGIAKQSVFEVYSRYIKKFVDNVDYVQKLIDLFKRSSKLDKVLLLDVQNEYLICGDSGALDEATYSFCWDVVVSSIDLANYSNYNDTFVVPFGRTFECILPYERNLDEAECYICVKGLNKCMVLVYVIEDTDEATINTIEHNFSCLCDALNELMKLHTDLMTLSDSSDFEKSLIFL